MPGHLLKCPGLRRSFLCGSSTGNFTALTRYHSGDEREWAAHQHDSSDNVEWSDIVGMRGGAECRDQDRAQDAARAPGCQHSAVDGTGILRPEEVGREGGHCAKTAAVAQGDDSGRNE